MSMARLFKQAAASEGLDCAIYSYEKSMLEPIACEGTVIPGLLWSDPAVFDDLRRICRMYDIDVIVPFVDGAVRVAAMMSDTAFAPTCSAALADAMFDKVEAARMFESLGLPVPRTYRPGDSPKELIAKPRRGSASKGIVSVDSAADLEALCDMDAYLVQERIDRREEYTVDCYVDTRDGRIMAVSPRLRIEVSGGEVTRTRTVRIEEVDRLARRTLDATGLRGAVTIQVIHDLDTGRYMIMEINPRLGGGAVCSVAAGADLPGLIIREALGRAGGPVCADEGVEIARYPQEVVFR